MSPPPPMTGAGIVAKPAPTTGTRPKTTRITPEIAVTWRLTTPVKFTRPTLCEYEVFGNALKSAATPLMTPSATSPPLSSSVVASRSTAASVPEMSPIVSMALIT